MVFNFVPKICSESNRQEQISNKPVPIEENDLLLMKSRFNYANMYARILDLPSSQIKSFNRPAAHI